MLPIASTVSRGGTSSSNIAQLLKKQISDLTDDPEKLKQLPHNMTIYHRLMDPKAFRDGTVPSAGSLYEEGQALMFGGGDTVGNTLMVGIHHLLQQPATLRTLKEELTKAWPTVSHEPTLSELEKLPYLNAVIKESLRMSSGVVSGLLRVDTFSWCDNQWSCCSASSKSFLRRPVFIYAYQVADNRFLRKYLRTLQRLHLPRANRIPSRALDRVR